LPHAHWRSVPSFALNESNFAVASENQIHAAIGTAAERFFNFVALASICFSE
jgi:hypothetical protein